MNTLKKNIRVFCKEILSGKSLARTLQNICVMDTCIKGDVVDLGARDGSGSYYRFLNRQEGTKLLFTDLNPQSNKNFVELNLEKELSFPSERFDTILLFHVLEHIKNTELLLKEICRISKPSGTLVMATPFLRRFHPDPKDYQRFTETYLIEKLHECGFSRVEIRPYGYGPFTAGYSQFHRILKFKPIVLIGAFVVITLDLLLAKLFKNSEEVKFRNYPLGFVVKAKK